MSALATAFAWFAATLREDRDWIDGRTVAFQQSGEIEVHSLGKVAVVLGFVLNVHDEAGFTVL